MQKRIIYSTVLALLLATTACFANDAHVWFNDGSGLLYANPGDVVTIHHKQDVSSNRTDLVWDGEDVNWKDGYQWTATPGVHIFRMYPRDLSNGKGHDHDWGVIIVSGAKDPGAFRNPGTVATQGQLDQIRKNIKISGHPMASAWSSYNHPSTSHTPNPVDTMNMKNATHKTYWKKDRAKLYQLALVWAVGGEQKYADAAIKILNAYASTNKSLMAQGIDFYPFLHTTHWLFQWFESADLLKNAKVNGKGSGWKDADIKTFDTYASEVLTPMTLGWRGTTGGPWGGQNQAFNVAMGRLQAGIYLNDTTVFNKGIHLLYDKRYGPYGGTSFEPIFGHEKVSLFELTINSHHTPGEYQEVNRDLGHMGMCSATSHQIAYTLWCQNGYSDYADFYGKIFYDDPAPRYFQGQNWLAKGTFTSGVPYSKKGAGGTIKLDAGCVGSCQQVYNHYHYLLNDKYQLSQDYVNYAKGGSNTSSRDRLLHARLNDGWEEGPVGNDIANTAAVSLLKSAFSMTIGSNRMLTITNSGAIKKTTVKLFNLSGKLIKNAAMDKKSKTVSLKGLNRGLFLIKIQGDGVREIEKILLK